MHLNTFSTAVRHIFGKRPLRRGSRILLGFSVGQVGNPRLGLCPRPFLNEVPQLLPQISLKLTDAGRRYVHFLRTLTRREFVGEQGSQFSFALG